MAMPSTKRIFAATLALEVQRCDYHGCDRKRAGQERRVWSRQTAWQAPRRALIAVIPAAMQVDAGGRYSRVCGNAAGRMTGGALSSGDSALENTRLRHKLRSSNQT